MQDLDDVLSMDGGPTLGQLLNAADKATDDDSTNTQDMPEISILSLLDFNRDKKGNLTTPKSTRRNVYTVLNKDSRWKDLIWEDLFKGTLMFGEEDYKDTNDTRICIWLDEVYDLQVGTTHVSEVTRLLGEENGKNPLLEYLDGVSWDSSDRIERWLIDGTGAEDTPLIRDMGRRWLIQAVARAYKPGCKADCVLVLIGKQGAKKSTTFAELAGRDFFADTPMEFGSANAYSQIRRAWIYEVAELDSVRRSANSATKAFLAAQEDTFRPPYGRHSITVKRHCVFCGTTNNKSFLNDYTGSRRFWPVEVGDINLDWIKENRDQIWAEAVHAYKAGSRWWLEEESATELEENSQRFQYRDPWEDHLREWLCRNQSEFTMKEVLGGALRLDPNQMNRGAEMRCSEILETFGYERRRKRLQGKRAVVWAKEGAEVIQFDEASQETVPW